MRFATFLLLFIISGLLQLQSQNTDESAFAGTHFIIGFMQNEVDIMTGGRTHKIILTAQETTKVTVKRPGWEVTNYIVPDTAYEYYADYDFVFDKSEEVGTDLFEIISEKPVVCYVFSSQLKSTDSYIAHPVNTWGNEYVITSLGIDHYYPDETLPPESQEFRLARRPGEFLIIASEDSTNVYIRPSEPTEKDWAGRESQVLLYKGEAYLVKAFPSSYGDNDLTGSYIKSDKPVGVLTGHVRASVPQILMRDKDNKDHLVEMIYSIDRWSHKYISLPFEYGVSGTGDMFKITSAYDSTIVNMIYADRTEQFRLDGIGDFKAIDKVQEPVRWVANKPVQIAQFMSHGVDFYDFILTFDPSLLMLPSQDKMVKKLFYSLPEYIFEAYRYETEKQFIAHKIAILMTQPAVSDITLNGTKISEIDSVTIKNIPGTSLFYVHVPILIGGNKIETANGYFAAWTYGYGEADSYAMTLASSLTSVVSNDTLPPEIEVSEDCGYIEGKVKEIYGIAEGGLGFVFPIDDETDNYNFEITKQTDTEIQFEASPENPQDDAVIAIDYRDLAGNGGVYKHFYKGLNIDFHGDIGIPNTEFGKSGFTFYRVKNNSDTIRTIYSVTFFKDTRLSYELENGGKLPYKMQPGEELLIKLIFSPIDDPAALDDSVFIRVDCNYMSRSRVRADVLLPKLLIKDLNFGKVLIFTQKKNEMIIVNNGTADIELERMEYIDKADEFYIDTIGVFPRRLLIDDTLKLEVTFSPKETKSYMASVYFVNNKNISNSCTITGIGAAPDVPDLIVDWGQKRVGTDNDTTVYLHNRGNWKAKIDYLNTISNTHEDANKNTLESLDNTIFESDSIALNLKYIPIKNEIYKIETNNQIAELSDSTFIIRLTGEPTIPEINLHEIYLGKVLIDDTVTGNYPAFTVGGNEHLTIKSISPILPVNTDFSTDVNTFAGQSYTVGQTVEANVQFAALELGRRTQYYLIEHDAMPNYAYKKDTLKIYADVIPRDTVLPVMEIIDDTGELCRMDSIVIRVRNRGNIDFLITDFSYQFENNPYFEAPPSLALPLSVSKDSFYDIAIENIFVEQEQSSLDVSITVNDTITIANEYDLTYTKLNNKISGFTEILAQAGQIDTVLVSGSLPGTEIDNIYLNLNVEFDYEILSYQGDEVLCIISGGGRQDCIKTKISMLQGKLFIQNPISIVSQNEERIWTVVLPFKVLYKNETSSQIHFEATFDACYLDIVEKIAVKVLPICIFDLLPIKINDKLPSVSINSRIVSSELELEVYIPESDFLISDIYDVTGEKINLNSELFLHKGASKLLIDVKSLTPGSYLLNVQYQSYNKKILFIKSI